MMESNPGCVQLVLATYSPLPCLGNLIAHVESHSTCEGRMKRALKPAEWISNYLRMIKGPDAHRDGNTKSGLLGNWEWATMQHHDGQGHSPGDSWRIWYSILIALVISGIRAKMEERGEYTCSIDRRSNMSLQNWLNFVCVDNREDLRTIFIKNRPKLRFYPHSICYTRQKRSRAVIRRDTNRFCSQESASISWWLEFCMRNWNGWDGSDDEITRIPRHEWGPYHDDDVSLPRRNDETSWPV